MATTQTPWTHLDASLAALAESARDLSPADLDRPTPCSDWTVRQVLQHAAGDQLGFASSLTGGPGPDFNPFDPSGDPTVDITALVETAVGSSLAAWSNVAADAEPLEIPIPIGPVDPAVGAAASALDAVVHAWDVAVAVGRPSPLTDEIAAALLAHAAVFVEPVRAFAYAPAMDGAGDRPADQLLRFLGRDPKWSA